MFSLRSLKLLLPNDYPNFWLKRGIVARLLQPFGNFYAGLGVFRYMLTQPIAVDVPVVCVGNLSIGGVGKTPVVAALSESLQAQGLQVHIIGHGYGGSIRAATQVDPTVHRASDVGDEALLHCQVAPTWIGRDRGIAARLACEAGADVILLDDGWQNPRLRHTMVIAVVDGDNPFGNGLLLPAGPLRLKPSALWSAHAVIALGQGVDSSLTGIEVIHGSRISTWRTPFQAEETVFAFCGLGKSRQFAENIQRLCASTGVNLSGVKAFPDHFPWDEEILQELSRAADTATLVTTAKDWQRLPEDWKERVRIVDLEIDWTDPAEFEEICQKICNLTK